MAFYARQGRFPDKRHIQFRRPDGALYAEELFSTKGFESVYSLAYHLRPPTATLDVQPWERPLVRFAANEPLRNRHWFTGAEARPGDAVEARVPLVGNDDIVLSTAGVTEPMEYFYRNSGGDEMLFVTTARACSRRRSASSPTASTTTSYVPMRHHVPLAPSDADDAARRRVVAAPITIPRKFRNDFGQLAEHAPYYERDFRAPVLEAPVDAVGEYEVRVTSAGAARSTPSQNHPFDVVGWDGYCYP